jgi:hypothetical protein
MPEFRASDYIMSEPEISFITGSLSAIDPRFSTKGMRELGVFG